MDYNSSATAPTSDEKSTAGEACPPPYYPNHPSGFPGTVNTSLPQQGYGLPYAGQYGQYPPQPGSHGVIITQPPVFVPVAVPVNDYLGYSIFTMLCCCLPLGLAALVYSIQTRDAITAGNHLAAESSSRTARILNHVALAVGIVIMIAWTTSLFLVFSLY